MENLKIKRFQDTTNNYSGGGISLTRDGEHFLEINFTGNLDLYFTLVGKKELHDTTFIIDKNSYEVYKIFDKLYNNIVTGCIFEPLNENDIERLIREKEFSNLEELHEFINIELEKEAKRKEQYRNQAIYSGLLKNNKIVWRSDDYPVNIAPFIVIEKKDDQYELTFVKHKTSRKLDGIEEFILSNPYNISIRFCNSGSRYNPFNVCFMKLYKELMETNYEKVYSEKYLVSKNLVKKR